MTETRPQFTPALGRHEFTGNYDRVVAVMTRERRWRQRMLDELVPVAGETIVDLGAGTGSFAVLVKDVCPDVRFIAVDPDPEVRAIAEAKPGADDVEFVTAFGDETIGCIDYGTVDKVTCSLVLHQCSLEAKTGILDNAFRMLRPGGRLLISDYGEQRTLLMQTLFRQIRMLDGFESTRPNKDGKIPSMMEKAGFIQVEELHVTATPTGSISLYSGWKQEE